MRIPLFSRLLLIFICSLTLIFAVSGQCLRDQQSYLLEFKNSLHFDSDSSTKLVRWNESVDCCSWEGVTCSEGRVVGLYLNSESIYGIDSSSSLFQLHYLQDLSLADNNFLDTSIPPEFGNLTNLSYLSLSNAGFSGKIPIEISHLTRLDTLDLSAKPGFLSGEFSRRVPYRGKLELWNPNFATLVQNLTRLKELYLDHVNISSQGNEWCQALSSSLPNLRVLSMSDCNLQGPLDSSLQKLQSLSIINLNSNNFFAPVPEFFADFKNLTSLNLRFCGLKEQFPKKIFQVPTLQMVDLSDNELLQGSLPEFYPNGSLQSLLLSGTQFSGTLPDSIGNLKRLSGIDLSRCNFNGSIPSSMASLTELVYLDMSLNNFTGSIPSFSMAKNLTMIDLSYNHLTGPTLVQNLTRLKELYLDHVNISSQGNEWCQALSSSLPNLRVLSMSDCNLQGPLDSSLQKLQSLSIINLNSNNFFAPVPEFFADFKNLTSLNLRSCGLKEQFPKKIFQVPTLQMVDLSDNELLQGSLPEFYPNGSLQSLLLSGTQFSGTLPDSIGNLKRLSGIDLSRCNFNGSIPSSMANLTELVYLDMSLNNFTGSIPSFSMAKNLTMIDLSYNHLTGQILASLFSLPSLQTLLLGNNHFSGQLHEFSNVSSFLLEDLDLSSNYLEGPIPTSIFELQGLRRLKLSSNNFNGSLQLNGIQQLRNLTYLYLSNNLLTEYNGTNSSLSSFPQIVVLNLASNKLKTFPEFLRHQANLEYLDLSNNQIRGEIPNWFWKPHLLLYVNLSCNYLEGPLHNLPLGYFIDLHSNQLQGQLPTPLPCYSFLDLSRNNFYSTIPELDFSWGFGFTSRVLSLSSNKFHGQIPESICNATSLGVLDLSNNSIIGTIPQCLSSMSNNLKVLNLRRNKLTGKISDKFPSNCALQTLNVNTNLLEGVVPKSLANCKNLEVLDIGNNKVHDSFPCHLKGMSNLHVLVLHSNKFYGSVGCGGSNVTWPILQIVDLASNNFSGRLSIKSLANSKLMVVDNEAQPGLNYLHFEHSELLYNTYYYQDVITVTIKGYTIELVKILTIFTSIDLSSNNFEGPIPEEIGVLKSLHILNLSHNSFTGQIPPSLGNSSQLESLDLSSNKLSGEIPVQIADGLTFLAVLNLSFNQLVGPIPYIKQFATFSETSYEGNKGLCGSPLKTTCTSPKPSSPPLTFQDSNSNSRPLIDWNFLSVELGFVFGFGLVIWPIMFCKRWRIWYCKHIDDILFRIFPQLYLGGKQYRGIRAHGNAGRRH